MKLKNAVILFLFANLSALDIFTLKTGRLKLNPTLLEIALEYLKMAKSPEDIDNKIKSLDRNIKNKIFKTRRSRPIVQKILDLYEIDILRLSNIAIADGLDELTKLIVESGLIDVNQLLLIAEHYQNSDILDMLINAAADINCKFGGATALMLAVQKLNIPFITKLLYLGADPDVEDDDGDTAIFWIVNSFDEGKIEESKHIIDLLIEYGADIDHVNNSNNNVLAEYAKIYEEDKSVWPIMEYLVSKGANSSIAIEHLKRQKEEIKKLVTTEPV